MNFDLRIFGIELPSNILKQYDLKTILKYYENNVIVDFYDILENKCLTRITLNAYKFQKLVFACIAHICVYD